MKDKEWRKLVRHIKNYDHKAICTPFDEKSVQKFVEHEYEILKIGSPSVTDIPLLEEIHYGVQGHIPVIMSVGGATEDEIDKALEILAREDVILMHCISEYPTSDVRGEQIQYLRNRYGGVVGYSCHQSPYSLSLPPADLYEFHVYVDEPPNDYSFSSSQMVYVLQYIQDTYMQRFPGPKPTKFMRKPYDDYAGRWFWKP